MEVNGEVDEALLRLHDQRDEDREVLRHCVALGCGLEGTSGSQRG